MTISLTASERRKLDQSEKILIRLMNRLLAQPDAQLDCKTRIAIAGPVSMYDTLQDACPNAWTPVQ
jgi:hypothetical protein